MYKLLIVDDEKMIREGIEKGIEWKQVGIDEVYTASSAKKALEIIEREHPQIMLTDISMEDVTGLELISEVRKSCSDMEMRILVLSGYSQFDYAKQCLQMQVQNFLLKPVDEGELVDNIMQQINILEEARIKKETGLKRGWLEGMKQQFSLEQFMRDLIHQKYQKEREIPWPEELQEVWNKPARVAILVQNTYMDKEIPLDQSLQQLTIKNMCMDLVDFQKGGITFLDNDGKIIIVFFDSDDSDSVKERVEELGKVLENECDIKVEFIFGSDVKKMNLLFISYNDALYAQETEKRYTKSYVIRDEKRDKLIWNVFKEFKEAMITDIANTGKVMHIYERFSQATLSYNLSRKQIQQWCFELATGIYMAYVMETHEKPDDRIESLISVLTGAAREDALEVTRIFIKNLVSDEEINQHEIVTEAMRYIDENLSAEISVASLAAKFYTSPNYFSRLFKKITGCGCNEYIVKKRIEKASILLETTTIKVGKIAMMVGYHDTNYFSLAFKKHIGKSPTVYRSEIQKEELIQ